MEQTSLSREPQPDHIEMLKKYFDLSSFRPKQWDIIRSIIEDRQDNCVAMATGYGKSLLYQYPSVVLEGLTIVISPLISLMEDQVRSLNLRNINSTYLGSAQRNDPTADIVAGKYRIVYLTPTYVMGETGQSLLAQVNEQLVLIAIDEAHCLSEWGHTFYEDYSELGAIRSNPILSEVPILAVSAVANSRVREDIATKLGIPKTQIWCTGFDRPNLNFRVEKKELYNWEDVMKLLNQNDGSSIIYCLTQNEVQQIAVWLNGKGIGCEVYHSNINLEKRSMVQKSFMENQVKIIVCTVAFGMGMHKPDVHLVIHYGVPMEFETYYLQVGQAGRDGNQAQCVMLWSEDDFNMHRIIRNLDDIPRESEKYLKISQIHERQSKTLHNYLVTKDCRRKFILQYFEDINPLCCDNCESILKTNSSQANSTETKNEEDIEPENPSPAKQPKLESA